MVIETRNADEESGFFKEQWEFLEKGGGQGQFPFLMCVWFHSAGDVPNTPGFVLWDDRNVTNFLLFFNAETADTQTTQHTQWSGLVVGGVPSGTVPTQN